MFFRCKFSRALHYNTHKKQTATMAVELHIAQELEQVGTSTVVQTVLLYQSLSKNVLQIMELRMYYVYYAGTRTYLVLLCRRLVMSMYVLKLNSYSWVAPPECECEA